MAKSIWKSFLDGEPITLSSAGKPMSRRIEGVQTGCEECALTDCGSRKFLDTAVISDKPELWLPYPGMTGHPTSDWNQLSRVMADYGLPFERFQLHYSVKCAPVHEMNGNRLLSKPTEADYNSCSTHTQTITAVQAQRRTSPSVIVMFGYHAGKTHSPGVYKMDAPVFWREDLQATVYVLPLPTKSVLTGVAEDSPAFFRLLNAAAWHVNNPGRYAWLHSLDVRPIYTAAEFRELKDWLKSIDRRVTLDIEDDGHGRLLCCCFTVTDEYSHVLVMDHPDNEYWESEKNGIWQLFYEFLADETIPKTFQYGAYDSIELEDKFQFVVNGYQFDTLIGSYLRESYHRKHGLEAIAQREFPLFAGYKTVVSQYYAKADGTDEESASSDRGFVGLANCPLDILVQYNGADGILTHKADVLYSDDVPAPLMRCYIGASIALRRAEDNGLYADPDHCKLVAQTAQLKLLTIQEDLIQLTKDTTFNPGSGPAVKKYMFDVFKLPRLGDIDDDVDDEDDPNVTDANALTRIAHETDHPFPKAILEYRTISKHAQYALKFQESASFYNGEVRTRFQVAGAASGRLRSSGEKDKPTGLTRKLNLQNVPRAGFVKNCICSDAHWRRVLTHAEPVLKMLRKAPRPSSNADEHKLFKEAIKNDFTKMRKKLALPQWLLAMNTLLISDLGGAESRVIAWLSQDPNLKAIFESGRDIHAAVGEMMGLGTYEYVLSNKKLRTRVKNLNFGLAYGLSPTGLYYYMKPMVPDITQAEAAALHAAYFEAFPLVKQFIDAQHAEYEATGQIVTEWGFVRHINSKVVKTNMANVSVNTEVQGSAHQLMLCSLAVLAERPDDYPLIVTGTNSGLSLEVHDAFYAKVALRDILEGRDQIQHLMEQANVDYSREVFGVNFDIPVVAEPSYGYTMGTEAMFDKELTEPGDLLLNWLIKYWQDEYFQSIEYGYQNRLI
jgi:DNA polymerase I-like protein with 3'-5' exonuclease and polymerase domains